MTNCVIGINIGGTEIKTVVIDENINIISDDSILTEVYKEGEYLTGNLINLIQYLQSLYEELSSIRSRYFSSRRILYLEEY